MVGERRTGVSLQVRTFFSLLKSYKAISHHLLLCQHCSDLTALSKLLNYAMQQVKIGNLLHCTTFSNFNWMCWQYFGKLPFLFNLMTQPHCVFVLVISIPLKLIRHLAHSSFAHQPAPAAPQPQLPSMVWPTYVIRVYQCQWRMTIHSQASRCWQVFKPVAPFHPYLKSYDITVGSLWLSV